MTTEPTTYTETDLARFADKVNMPAEGREALDCWIWTGAKHSKEQGYGKFRLKINGEWKTVNAHKAAYLLFKGPVPAGKVVAHQCNNERCVNPLHLEPETQSENMKFCVKSGRHNSQRRKAA
jgi:hypothetical protein